MTGSATMAGISPPERIHGIFTETRTVLHVLPHKAEQLDLVGKVKDKLDSSPTQDNDFSQSDAGLYSSQSSPVT